MVSGMSRLGCGFLQPNKHDEQITFAIIIVHGYVGLPKRRQPNLRGLAWQRMRQVRSHDYKH